jgi:hypothetical protein
MHFETQGIYRERERVEWAIWIDGVRSAGLFRRLKGLLRRGRCVTSSSSVMIIAKLGGSVLPASTNSTIDDRWTDELFATMVRSTIILVQLVLLSSLSSCSSSLCLCVCVWSLRTVMSYLRNSATTLMYRNRVGY